MKNISWSIFITGFILAITVNHGESFLPILLITIGINALVRSWMTGNGEKKFNSLSSFIWWMTIALCFATGNWLLIVVGVSLSMLLHATRDQIMTAINSQDMLKAKAPLPAYPPLRPSQEEPPYIPYEQGYLPLSPTHQMEQRALPPTETAIAQTEQYEQPQALYPQQMPPQ